MMFLLTGWGGANVFEIILELKGWVRCHEMKLHIIAIAMLNQSIHCCHIICFIGFFKLKVDTIVVKLLPLC